MLNLIKSLWFVSILTLFFVVPAHASVIDDYQRDIDIYRGLYEPYQIKHNEFVQFGTFKAEEDLVTAANQMLLARADVWMAYWKMMNELILPVNSLQPATLTNLSNYYNEEMNWLNRHKTNLTTMKRRDQLMSEAQVLNIKNDAYQTQASMGTVLLYAGRLKQITNKLIQLNEDLNKRVNDQLFTLEVKAVKQRGLQVNRDRLVSVREHLMQIEKDYTEDVLVSSESIDRIKTTLEPIYQETKQLRTVLHELAEDIEW